MKILLISDEESSYLWDFYQPGRLKDIDLILSCGDLKAEYLSFLVTMSHAPLLYVPGNHDGGYAAAPPEGCDCIDGKLVRAAGLRILGLGGCPRYSGGPNQYTEAQMLRRINRVYLPLRRAGGADIIVTHAPVRGFGDEPDYAHRGFEAFLPLLDRFPPRYLVHGHVHTRYGAGRPRVLEYGSSTRIVNACGYYILDLE